MGPYNFVRYTADYILEAYKNKPQAEQKRLFIAAFQWTDHREEYPGWHRENEKKQERAITEKAKQAKPTNCPRCETRLNGDMACYDHGFFEFDEMGLEYKFYEAGPLDFSEELKKFKSSEGRAV